MKSWKVLLVYIVVALAIFGVSLNDFFVSDDFDWLLVGKEGSWWRPFVGNYFGEHGIGGSFRPLTAILFKFQYLLFGLNPIGYHLVSVAALATCAYLLFKLSSLFLALDSNKYVPFLSGLIFLLMPHHTEAVVWIAAVADPVGTIFYLLSLYFYLQSKNYNLKPIVWMLLSFLSFAISLGFKETAITLPLVLLGYELIIRRNLKPLTLLKHLTSYFALAISFVLYRSWAIGLTTGYYGRSQFLFRPKEWLATIINLDLMPFVQNEWRIIAASLLIKFWLVYAFMLACLMLWWLWSFIKNKYSNLLFLIYFWFANVALVMLLPISMTNDEGERYGFIPSLVVAVLLAYAVISSASRERSALTALTLMASIFLIISWGFSFYKKFGYWEKASNISQGIIKNSQISISDDQKTYFLGLPDSYHEAPILRNGLIPALKLFQNIEGSFERIPVYTIMEYGDIKYGIKNNIPDGLHFEIKDGKYLVKGNATETHPDYKFELWGYDYSKSLSSKIHLQFRGQALEKWLSGNSQVYYYENGTLIRAQK